MAGPSGAGAATTYLKMTRTARTSAQREIRAALRRKAAREGRLLGDYASFECYRLCMSCGYLSEPSLADPLRSDPTLSQRSSCPACTNIGLADLRHSPTADALCELENDERGLGHRFGRFARGMGVAAGVLTLAGVGTLMFLGDTADQTFLAMFPMTLLSMPLILQMAQGKGVEPSKLPRRWRLPLGGRDLHRLPRRRQRSEGVAEARGELLRAPLSGRPCLAYELGVRDDARPKASPESWRLLEQANTDFAVGSQEVRRDQALLRLPRTAASVGMVMNGDANTRHFMRMRGLPEAEVLHVYETVLLPGAPVRVGQVEGDGPLQIFAR